MQCINSSGWQAAVRIVLQMDEKSSRLAHISAIDQSL